MKIPSISFFCWLLLSLHVSTAARAQLSDFSGDSAASSAGLRREDGCLLSGSKTATLQPVFFHYTRRKLMCDGKRLNPAVFLSICRCINDSAVQEQVARYDALTREKQRLGLGMIASSFSGFAFLGAALGSPEPDQSLMFGVTAGVAILAVPVMAMCTTAPHQARKAILFRDLPVAYNAYLEACLHSDDRSSQ